MTGAGLAGENSTDLSSVVKGLQALSEGLDSCLLRQKQPENSIWQEWTAAWSS